MSSLKDKIKAETKSTQVVVFGRISCPLTQRVKKLFDVQQVAYKSVDFDKIDNGEAIKDVLQSETRQGGTPYVYVNGAYCGGLDTILATFTKGLLSDMIVDATMAADSYVKKHQYDYDLIVIGGGSGGLACAKAAAAYPGVKVACLDYVRPSPIGTQWGLGGTCVNVGCIPKKLMHQAALLGKGMKDARKFGWKFDEQVTHCWSDMVTGIQDHIRSLNFKYRTDLRSKGVKYINALGELVNQHSVKHFKPGGADSFITAARIVIATGGRPRYPNIPGAKEYGITSDDLFSLQTPPGKTVVIGASYVALECAGFLAELGFPTYCMVRSILLRGFDQQMAEKIGNQMTKNKVNFLHSCIPLAVELVSEGTPRVLRLHYKNLVTSKEGSFECNTVMFAIGRDPDTLNLNLGKAGVITDESGYIPTVHEQTNVPNVYAIGDVQKGKLQLTPLAIKAGRLLADRLFGSSKACCNYFDVATTVFTPLEYGCIGLAEEDAEMIFGKERIEVYHASFTPLEYTVPQRDSEDCYMKLICDKMNKMKVIGLHVTGPNAGEITQGYALAMRIGVKKSDFDSTIGIHPTCSETFTTLRVTKSSGSQLATENC